MPRKFRPENIGAEDVQSAEQWAAENLYIGTPQRLLGAARDLVQGNARGAFLALFTIFHNVRTNDVNNNLSAFQRMWGFVGPMIAHIAYLNAQGQIEDVDDEQLEALFMVDDYVNDLFGGDATSTTASTKGEFLESEEAKGDEEEPYKVIKEQVSAVCETLRESSSLGGSMDLVLTGLQNAIASLNSGQTFLKRSDAVGDLFVTFAVNADFEGMTYLLESLDLLSTIETNTYGTLEALSLLSQINSVAFEAYSRDTSRLEEASMASAVLPISGIISGNLNVLVHGFQSAYTGDNELPDVPALDDFNQYISSLPTDTNADLTSLFESFSTQYSSGAYADAISTLSNILTSMSSLDEVSFQSFLFDYVYGLSLLNAAVDNDVVETVGADSFNSFLSLNIALLGSLVPQPAAVEETEEQDIRSSSVIDSLYQTYSTFVGRYELDGFDQADPYVLQVYVNLILAMWHANNDYNSALFRLGRALEILYHYTRNFDENYSQVTSDVTTVFSFLQAGVRASSDYQSRYQGAFNQVRDSYRHYMDNVGSIASTRAIEENMGRESRSYLRNFPAQVGTQTPAELRDFIATEVIPQLDPSEEADVIALFKSLLSTIENAENASATFVVYDFRNIVESALGFYNHSAFGLIFQVLERVYNRLMVELYNLDSESFREGEDGVYGRISRSLNLLFYNLILGRSSTATATETERNDDGTVNYATLASDVDSDGFTDATLADDQSSPARETAYLIVPRGFNAGEWMRQHFNPISTSVENSQDAAASLPDPYEADQDDDPFATENDGFGDFGDEVQTSTHDYTASSSNSDEFEFDDGTAGGDSTFGWFDQEGAAVTDDEEEETTTTTPAPIQEVEGAVAFDPGLVLDPHRDNDFDLTDLSELGHGLPWNFDNDFPPPPPVYEPPEIEGLDNLYRQLTGYLEAHTFSTYARYILIQIRNIIANLKRGFYTDALSYLNRIMQQVTEEYQQTESQIDEDGMAAITGVINTLGQQIVELSDTTQDFHIDPEFASQLRTTLADMRSVFEGLIAVAPAEEEEADQDDDSANPQDAVDDADIDGCADGTC